MELLPALGGVLAGLLAGTFGIGGGSITIPILVFILDMPTPRAVATNLLIVFLTSSFSLLFHAKNGTLKPKGVLMGLTGVLGTFAGNALFFRMNERELNVLLGTVFIVIAFLMLVSKEGKREAGTKELVLTGLFMGFYSALVGKGGGSIAVPILILVFNVLTKDAIGSSVAATPIVAFSSMLPKALAGLVEYGVALLFVPGMLLGAYLGSRIMRRARPKHLRRAFSLVMVLVGIKFLMSV